MCGFAKDTYYFYQSQWTEEPMVHVFPHWNWEGLEGVKIPVVAYSNCESVELFLNDRSLGEKTMGDSLDLVWKVPYEAGVLKAIGKNQGKVSCESEVTTAGSPAKIQLLADRQNIRADKQDVVHIEVNILDDQGGFMPIASNTINFSVEGAGTIIALDNGDPLCEISFAAHSRPAFNGKCLLIVKSTDKFGEIKIHAESEGLTGAELTIKSK